MEGGVFVGFLLFLCDLPRRTGSVKLQPNAPPTVQAPGASHPQHGTVERGNGGGSPFLSHSF